MRVIDENILVPHGEWLKVPQRSIESAFGAADRFNAEAPRSAVRWLRRAER